MASADDVAAAVLERRPVDQMQLHKLLYLIQAASLAWFDETAFEQEIQAWTYGPMVRQVAGHYKDWGTKPITQVYTGSPKALDDRTRWTVEYVMEHYSELSGPDLAALVKKPGSPWRQVRGDLPADARSSVEIPPELIKEYHAEHGLTTPELNEEEVKLVQSLIDGDDDAIERLLALGRRNARQCR